MAAGVLAALSVMLVLAGSFVSLPVSVAVSFDRPWWAHNFAVRRTGG